METVTLCRKWEEVDMPFAMVSVQQAYFIFFLSISHMPLVMDISSLVKFLFLTGFGSKMLSALKALLLYFELHKSQYYVKKYSKFNSPCPICPIDVHLTATIRYQPVF